MSWLCALNRRMKVAPIARTCLGLSTEFVPSVCWRNSEAREFTRHWPLWQFLGCSNVLHRCASKTWFSKRDPRGRLRGNRPHRRANQVIFDPAKESVHIVSNAQPHDDSFKLFGVSFGCKLRMDLVVCEVGPVVSMTSSAGASAQIEGALVRRVSHVSGFPEAQQPTLFAPEPPPSANVGPLGFSIC